jgi:hypothetical protein|nr:MAG TPA_asm: tail protein [Caudoviricetes sp.]
MSVNQAVNLNLSTDIVPPVLKMVQNDSNSRYIVASLWDGASAYDVGSASVMMRFAKPDGTGGMYDADEAGNAVSVDGNVVTIPVATQVLTVAGDVFAQVDIYGSSNSKLASFAFKIDVAASVYPDAQIISSDYYNILTATIANAVTAAQNAAASATAAAQSADSAAASVDGAVKYNAPQTLTDAQKQQARDNINASAPYTAGENISISGSVIATKAFPCNPNLLVNWYFGNPVNQRGQTSYPGGAYAIDRWLPSSGNTSLVVKDGFLTVTTRTDGAAVDQIQEFPYPPGTVLTLSALMRCTTANAGLQCRFGKDGTATDYSETVTLTGTGDWELVTLPLTIPSGIGAVLQSPRFRGTAAGITYDIKAIKLELGTQQTLAHQENGVWVLNEIPDHSEQYRRCLRYFQSIQGKNFPIFAGEVGATGRLYFTVPLIEPMRSGVTVADVAASDIYTTAGRAKLIDAPGYGVWAQHLNTVTIWTAKNSVKDYTTDADIAGAGAVCMATLNLSAELSGV